MQRHVVLLIAGGFTDSGVSIALDVLRTANSLAVRAAKSPPFKIDVASAWGGQVRAASGLVLAATKGLSIASRADILLVPGIWAETESELDEVLLREDVQKLVHAVRLAHARGAIVGSSCDGAFLLADAGVLDGLACTTTWWLAPHLKRRHPEVDLDGERALIAHDRVITAGAVFAQADLALHLVSRFAGPKAARQCAKLLLLDTHPSQAPYMAIRQLSANDPTVRRAETWVRAHLAQDFDIPLLAKNVGISARTLSRRLMAAVGLSPLGFVQRLRVETAVHMIETSRLSLQEISTRVGYVDTNALRRLIRRETRTSPRELRKSSAS